MAAPKEIEQHFGRNEVLTSSELVTRVVATGRTREGARKLISRSVPGSSIWRSRDLRLPRNERLFAQTAFKKKAGFAKAVAAKLKAVSRPGLARCLAVLDEKCVVHHVDAMRLLAVGPDGAGKRSYAGEVAGLRELGIEVLHEGTGNETLVDAGRSVELAGLAAAAAQNVRSSAVLARVLIKRLQDQNLLAWNQVSLPDVGRPFAEFNGQVFTAYRFSYLAPLVRWKKDKKQPTPCPVVLDCYADSCAAEYVLSLVERIKRAAHRGNSRMPVLGVIGAPRFERDAWKAARRAGLVAVNLRQAFGDEALAVMAEVETLLQSVNDLKLGEARFEKYARLVEELRSNPIVAELRAIGLETIAGLALGADGFEQVALGKVVDWNKTKRDIDVLGIRGACLRVVECKAYHRNKSVSVDDVEKFINETLPAAKSWARNNDRVFSRCEAHIWTTGTKGKDGADRLYQLQQSTKDRLAILRIKELEPLLPTAIKKRSLQLLNAIATATDDLNEGP